MRRFCCNDGVVEYDAPPRLANTPPRTSDEAALPLMMSKRQMRPPTSDVYMRSALPSLFVSSTATPDGIECVMRESLSVAPVLLALQIRLPVSRFMIMPALPTLSVEYGYPSWFVS